MSVELETAAAAAVHNLEELSSVLDRARVPISRKNEDHNSAHLYQPRVLSYMCEAVQAAGDLSLTPMAAVAGSIADLTVEVLSSRGATKAFANNGGDIAMMMTPEEQTSIGIVSCLANGKISHRLTLTGQDGIGGVAASGLGGRGLTKGLADAVVVLAENARQADACATLIANETFVESPEVLRVKAEILDPQTDLVGQMVTQKVHTLPPAVILKSLNQSREAALRLMDKSVIKGVYIFVQGQMAAVPESFPGKTIQLQMST